MSNFIAHPKQLTNPTDALAFVKGGNSTLTFVGRVSRFTYKIRKHDTDDIYFVSLLTGSNNDSDYRYIGCITDARGFFTTAKSFAPQSPSVKAFGFVFRNLTQGVIHPEVQIWHEGKCCRCGRKLTTPESLERGIGPECAKR